MENNKCLSTGPAMMALQRLESVVRSLESDPDMCKGTLVQRVLIDQTVDWDALYDCMDMKGRHRRKRRWKQWFVVHHLLRRKFPRGGSRRHSPRHLPADTPTPLPLKTAPWFVDIRELAPFRPEEVLEHLAAIYPILALYRTGWQPAHAVSHINVDFKIEAWNALWQEGEHQTILSIGSTLGWPLLLLQDAADIILPVARLLWPQEPWDAAWVEVGTGRVARASVPFLRRAACLLHGFQIGGCSARGVWEAMRMPTRSV